MDKTKDYQIKLIKPLSNKDMYSLICVSRCYTYTENHVHIHDMDAEAKMCRETQGIGEEEEKRGQKDGIENTLNIQHMLG